MVFIFLCLTFFTNIMTFLIYLHCCKIAEFHSFIWLSSIRLQCSCLENPRDGEAWWAADYGVAQSWTWLKWLSSSSSSIPLYMYTHTHTYTHTGFLGGSVVKNLPANAGYLGSIPGSGRSLGGGNGNPFQYSCLENPMDRGAWRATVHGVTKESNMI